MKEPPHDPEGQTEPLNNPVERPELPELSIEGLQVTRELHRGGQGVVYQAIQKSTKRKVAVKFLLQGPHASRAAKRRFEREIEIVAQLKHPNIISIFDSGETSLGLSYFVMDYVRGEQLHRHVREKALSMSKVLTLFESLCDAIQYAHQRGVIHRDLKPSNILVDSKGEIRVLDFGLAKSLVSPEETVVSMTQDVVGTLPYISPEQAKGNPDEIDTRTDVYSLGIILYELLTGEFPYPVHGHPAEVLRHIAETPPKPPRKLLSSAPVESRGSKNKRLSPIDRTLEAILLKSLSKDSSERYQSAAELRSDIRRYRQNEPITAVPTGFLTQAYLLGRRHKRVMAGIAFGLVALLLGLTVCLKLYYQTQEALTRESQQLRIAEGASRAARREADLAVKAEKEASQHLEKIRESAIVWQLFIHKSLHGDAVHTAEGKPSIEGFLDAAGRYLESDLSNMPDSQTFLRASIGHAYERLDLQEIANAHKQASRSDDMSLPSRRSNSLEKRRNNEFIRMVMRSSVQMVPVICDEADRLAEAGRPVLALDHLREAIVLCEPSSEAFLRTPCHQVGGTISNAIRLGDSCPFNLEAVVREWIDRCDRSGAGQVLQGLVDCGYDEWASEVGTEILASQSPISPPEFLSIAGFLLSEDRIASNEEVAETCDKLLNRMDEAIFAPGRVLSQIAYSLGRIGQFEKAEDLLVNEIQNESSESRAGMAARSLIHLQGNYGPKGNSNPIYDEIFEVRRDSIQADQFAILGSTPESFANRRKIDAQIQLYEFWDKTRPGQGHAKKASEFRSRKARIRRDIPKELDTVLAELSKTKVGVSASVVEVRSGRTVYEKNSQEPIMAGALTRLLVMAAAIDLLGPQFGFETTLSSNGRDLLVVGSGDPSFGYGRRIVKRKKSVNDEFRRWVESMRHSGLEAVTGDIILDQSLFDVETVHRSWKREDRRHWYAAPVGALNYHQNVVTITVHPGQAIGSLASWSADPETDLLQIVVNCTTAESHDVSLESEPHKWTYSISGECYQSHEFLPIPIHDPGVFFGETFATVLESEGIKFYGKVRLGRSGGQQDAWKTIASTITPLSDVLLHIGKNENALYANCLFKRLGAEHGADDPSSEGSGSWANGSKAITEWIGRIGIDTAGLNIVDGSGLSRDNTCTMRQLAGLLARIGKNENSELLISSIPVYGRSGTVRVVKAVQSDARKLAGFIMRGESPIYAFAIMIHGDAVHEVPQRFLESNFFSVLVPEAK